MPPSPQNANRGARQPTRRRREQARAREDILAAAARAFAKAGIGGCTMEDIAAEAGFAQSSLYTYFKGKEQLCEALFSAVEAQFDALKRDKALDRMPFPQRLEWLIGQHLALVEKNRDFFAMFYTHRACFEGCGRPEGAPAATRGARAQKERFAAFLGGFLAKGIAAGELRLGDAHQWARFVAGAIHATVFGWLASGGDLAAQARPLCEFVLYGLTAGPAAEQPVRRRRA